MYPNLRSKVTRYMGRRVVKVKMLIKRHTRKKYHNIGLTNRKLSRNIEEYIFEN